MLAAALEGFRGKDTVVLGIPRGGMVVASEIAGALNSELDIALSRKLGAPGNPELAIGSIGEDGKLFLNEDLAFRAGADKVYIETEKARQLAEIKNRVQLFRQFKAKVVLKGKTVIVTDDGVATGAHDAGGSLGKPQGKSEKTYCRRSCGSRGIRQAFGRLCR